MGRVPDADEVRDQPVLELVPGGAVPAKRSRQQRRDQHAQLAGLALRDELTCRPPVQPRQRPADEEHQPQRGERLARREAGLLAERREAHQHERHPVLVDPKLEVIPAHQERVVGEVKAEGAADEQLRERPRIPGPQARPEGFAAQQPDAGHEREPERDPVGVLEQKSREVAHAGLGPRGDLLRIIRIRQPVAVGGAPPQHVRDGDQQRQRGHELAQRPRCASEASARRESPPSPPRTGAHRGASARAAPPSSESQDEAPAPALEKQRRVDPGRAAGSRTAPSRAPSSSRRERSGS